MTLYFFNQIIFFWEDIWPHNSYSVLIYLFLIPAPKTTVNRSWVHFNNSTWFSREWKVNKSKVCPCANFRLLISSQDLGIQTFPLLKSTLFCLRLALLTLGDKLQPLNKKTEGIKINMFKLFEESVANLNYMTILLCFPSPPPLPCITIMNPIELQSLRNLYNKYIFNVEGLIQPI